MTYDEAKEALAEEKTVKKDARTELKAFDKEHKVKKGNTDDLKEKVLKKRDKLVTAVENSESKIEELKGTVKKLKPRKERDSKYSYPEEMKDDPKAQKRFRASMRGKAKTAGVTTEEYLKDPEKYNDEVAKAKKKSKDKKEKKKGKDEKKDKKSEKKKSKDKKDEEDED